MNRALLDLYPPPVEGLKKLKAARPCTDHDLRPIDLSIGEARQILPSCLDQLWRDPSSVQRSVQTYPTTLGLPELRQACADWLVRRFALDPNSLDPARHVLPVSGTREGLFSFTQAVVTSGRDERVVIPNPFYHIYEGAALLAGATPYYLPAFEEANWEPDLSRVPSEVWRTCALVFLCSPGNPTGRVHSLETWRQLIELADTHDFTIAADECYSEIYLDERRPPLGLLEACRKLGRDDYRRCVVFHSLSKRSSMPGLRSGFVAGDAQLLKQYLLYRMFHGCTMPVLTQRLSALTWRDEAHVVQSRENYRRILRAMREVLARRLEVSLPDGGFYLWVRVPADDQDFCQRLFAEQAVTAFPGSLLSRACDGRSPGAGYVRLAAVCDFSTCVEAAQRVLRLLD